MIFSLRMTNKFLRRYITFGRYRLRQKNVAAKPVYLCINVIWINIIKYILVPDHKILLISLKEVF